MNQHFAAMFATWVENPKDKLAVSSLNDVLLEGSEEETAKKFKGKGFTVYYAIVDDDDDEEDVAIKKKRFSTLAEAKAFMDGFKLGEFELSEYSQLIISMVRQEVKDEITEIFLEENDGDYHEDFDEYVEP